MKIHKGVCLSFYEPLLQIGRVHLVKYIVEAVNRDIVYM